MAHSDAERSWLESLRAHMAAACQEILQRSKPGAYRLCNTSDTRRTHQVSINVALCIPTAFMASILLPKAGTITSCNSKLSYKLCNFKLHNQPTHILKINLLLLQLQQAQTQPLLVRMAALPNTLLLLNQKFHPHPPVSCVENMVLPGDVAHHATWMVVRTSPCMLTSTTGSPVPSNHHCN